MFTKASHGDIVTSTDYDCHSTCIIYKQNNDSISILFING